MMRNPRRLIKPQVDGGLVESVARSDAPPLLPSTPPNEDALFWRMWGAWEHVAAEALGCDFVQGIGRGTLDPVAYGAFVVADAWYCFRGPGVYADVAQRAEDAPLRAFLEHKRDSYEQYNASFTETWRLRDAESIEPTAVLRQYAAFEERVAHEEAPIYTLVAMLPCEHLWAWLGSELAPPNASNLYAPWINNNNDLHSAYQIGNYLEDFAKRHPGALDDEKAIAIYGKAMTFEMQNFKSATSST